jgi:hypothetical protein
MRPLHRPMFRYGGPIKEGVMSGIREPVRKAALVGNSVYPQTGGREHHNIIKTIFGWGAKPVLGAAGKKTAQETAKKTVGTETVRGIKSLWDRIKPTTKWRQPPVPKGYPMGSSRQIGSRFNVSGKGFEGPAPYSKMEILRNPSLWWKAVKENPKWAASAALYGAAPTYGIGKAVVPRLATEIADRAVPDWIYNWETGRWFNPDDTDLKPEDKKILDEKITENIVEEPKVPQKSAEEIRAERIQKYRDIMDIKGMNKRAAYDSLIDASKLVGESGDFKGDIKSGKLINDIIQATSKQFDKPAKTKDAIDTLILKGEIEADIAAGKPSTYLKTAQDMVATGAAKNITEAMKLLTKSSNSMATTLGTIANKGIRLDEEQVGIAYRGETGKIPKGMIKVSEVNEWIEDNPGKDELDYVKEYMTKTELAPGDYIIGKRVVTVDKDKKVSFFY